MGANTSSPRTASALKDAKSPREPKSPLSPRGTAPAPEEEPKYKILLCGDTAVGRTVRHFILIARHARSQNPFPRSIFHVLPLSFLWISSCIAWFHTISFFFYVFSLWGTKPLGFVTSGPLLGVVPLFLFILSFLETAHLLSPFQILIC